MYESVVAQKLAERGLQQGIQQGLQQGQRQQSIEDLLDVLEIRFDARAVEPLKPKIEVIEELHILKQLHRSAVQVADLDEFQRILDSIVQSQTVVQYTSRVIQRNDVFPPRQYRLIQPHRSQAIVDARNWLPRFTDRADELRQAVTIAC